MTGQPRKPADARRAEIEEATLRLMHELGPDRLTTSHIARAVGISQPAVFRHFPTKDSLWEAAARRVESRAVAAWEHADNDGPCDPLESLRRLLAAQLRVIQALPVLPALAFSQRRQAASGAARMVLGGLMQRFLNRLERRVEAAQEAGLLCRDTSPGDVALLLLGVVQGAALRWSVAGEQGDLVAEGRRLAEVQLLCLRPAAPCA